MEKVHKEEHKLHPNLFKKTQQCFICSRQIFIQYSENILGAIFSSDHDFPPGVADKPNGSD